MVLANIVLVLIVQDLLQFAGVLEKDCRSSVKSANTPDIIIANVIQGLNITISKPNTRLIIDNVPKRG